MEGGKSYKPGACGPFRLTPAAIDFVAPAFAEGGHRLLTLGQERRAELVKLSPPTGAFEPFLGGIPAQMVDFSKDGELAVYAGPSGSAAATTVPNVWNWSARPRCQPPLWSPDGRWIGFSGQRGDDPWRLWILPRWKEARQAQCPCPPPVKSATAGGFPIAKHHGPVLT